MNGYTISYLENGLTKETFLGDPLCSEPIPPQFRLALVLSVFMESRPAAEPLSIIRSRR